MSFIVNSYSQRPAHPSHTHEMWQCKVLLKLGSAPVCSAGAPFKKFPHRGPRVAPIAGGGVFYPEGSEVFKTGRRGRGRARIQLRMGRVMGRSSVRCYARRAPRNLPSGVHALAPILGVESDRPGGVLKKVFKTVPGWGLVAVQQLAKCTMGEGRFVFKAKRY